VIPGSFGNLTSLSYLSININSIGGWFLFRTCNSMCHYTQFLFVSRWNHPSCYSGVFPTCLGIHYHELIKVLKVRLFLITTGDHDKLVFNRSMILLTAPMTWFSELGPAVRKVSLSTISSTTRNCN
jgi:hypothetical protein